MRPYEYNDDQRRSIAEAKAAGKPRVFVPLTDEQTELEREYLQSVEDEVRRELGHDPQLANPLALQLRNARKQAGLSLADVAERAGMTKQAVLKIETGQNANPKIETLNRIAEAIGKAIKIELVDSA